MLTDAELKTALADLRNWLAENEGEDNAMLDVLKRANEATRFADEAELPDACFAIVDGDQRSVPLCNAEGKFDAAKVDAAISSFMDESDGDDGDDAATLPDDVRNAAVKRIKRAWARANPDKAVDDMPKIAALTGAIFASSKSKDENRTSDYLGAMIEALQEKYGDLFDADWFKAAHATARGKAGGKAAARNKKEKATVDAAEYRAHLELHNDPAQFSESCQFCCDYGYGVDILKLAKADERVDYRAAGETEANCFACRFYRWGVCNLVEGSIEASDVCDLWQQPVKTYPDPPTASFYSVVSRGTAKPRKFYSALPKAFADAPEWINVLPIPGKYAHPLYGMILIDEARNQMFIDNFDARVYQQELPITLDLEHDGKWSGAQGVIEELKMSADGSVDARISWTERGKVAVESESFGYFSPEWWDSWTDPATQITYENVLIGGALTVRPFFKEDALRPLVASESGLAVLGATGGAGSEFMTRQESQGVAKVTEKIAEVEVEVKTVQMSEADLKALREAAASAVALSEQVTALQAADVANKERIQAMENDKRRKRFTDLVSGRGEGAADGAKAWHGAIEGNVSTLELLADTLPDGEANERFIAHVETMTANAITFAEAAMFKHQGSAEIDADNDAWSVIETRAKAYSEEKHVDFSTAVDAVTAADPELARRYNEQRD